MRNKNQEKVTRGKMIHSRATAAGRECLENPGTSSTAAEKQQASKGLSFRVRSVRRSQGTKRTMEKRENDETKIAKKRFQTCWCLIEGGKEGDKS